ncbi:hypothetical protein [Bradyrhizobium sp. Mp27]|uniref:hypothetical protein n=1 Tax=Bradyrhizobium sp. Mp27 TaxID=3042157 RepID=UPI00248AE546|nr:hypothetical protein [Bradyrhizobium sp. Mp27]MDI2073042.1 hypothetical protein [Bradyrhizobium sp. Mp27]
MTELARLLDPPTHARMIRLAHLHGRNLNQREIDRFAALGVPAVNLGTPWPVLVDKVAFCGGYFSFAEDVGLAGEQAFTFVVFSNAGMIDIAAWQPATQRLALWCGEGFALGERQIQHPNPLVDGLRVFRSPIEWLRAGRCGIVILQPGFARSALADVPILVAEDELHQKELQGYFALTGPQITVGKALSLETA